MSPASATRHQKDLYLDCTVSQLCRSSTLGFRIIKKYLVFSVTSLGDLLDFGQLFKAFGNNIFVQVSYIPTFLGNFCKGVKIFNIFETFIDIWRFFTGHTASLIFFPYFFSSRICSHSIYCEQKLCIVSRLSK